MKTIKEINKLFDEKFCKERFCQCCGKKECDYSITGCPQYRNEVFVNRDGHLSSTADEIKSFYTQQILSLIEELEGKLIKTIQDKYDKEKNTKPFIHKMLFQTAREARERHQGFLSGLLVSIDQMRASIKSFINESGVKS